MSQKLKLVLMIIGILVHTAIGVASQEHPLLAAPPRSLHQLIRLQIEQDFFLRTELSQSELEFIVHSAIRKANPRLEGLPRDHSKRLASDLIGVTRCLGIDPVIFTALIWRESNFKPHAMSETGAVGLTQMTLPAVREILERTHHQGVRRLQYARNLFRKCAPSVFRNLPVVVDHQSAKKMKSIIAMSTLDGLVFGAFLLKLNLASIRTSTSHFHKYSTALENYNGDPKVKSSFAKDILALTRRMIKQSAVASNDSQFLRQNPGL